MKFNTLLAGAALALFSTAAFAQTYPVPQVAQIGPNDLFQDLISGVPQAQSWYASQAQVGNLAFVQAGNGYDNAIIGGDFYQNLWSRGTTSATINTTTTYGPNNWVLWSGTSTNLVATQQTGAADIPVGALASARITRSSTGVVQSCFGQTIESSIAARFQAAGTAELDFSALAGSGFSDAASALHVYFIYGTTTDEGSAKMAYTVNTNGGGGSSWTGGALLGGTNGFTVPISTAWNRYTVVAPIPATAKELGVAICWTPVGASPSNDYVDLANVQLVPNTALTAVAGATGAVLNVNDVRAKSPIRRSTATEVALQQRYLYAINEGTITAGTAMAPAGMAPTATTCLTAISFPVTMRTAPTYTNALTASTFKLNSAAANVALSTPFSATTGVNTTLNGSVTFTATTLGATAGFSCILVSAAGSGSLLFTAEL